MNKFIRIFLGMISAGLIVLIVGLYYLTENVLPYSPIKPSRLKHSRIINSSNIEQFDIIVEDSIKLKGLFIHSTAGQNTKPLGTVILLHGSSNSMESQYDLAQVLSKNGFNAIVFDLRAQGESGGTYCTFGFYEKYDVSRYIDAAIKKYKDVEPFAIMGHSLGGAIAIQAMAIDKRIKCGIISSTFTSLKEVTYEYMKRYTGIPFKFISDRSLKNSERIARFPVQMVSPEEYAKKVYQPTLLIHGTMDKNIPIIHGKRIFSNLNSKEKQWYAVKGADHNNLWTIGGIGYQERIIKFLKDNI
ncbi:MAG: alpha/beta fold hydrolase [Bacteroidota bacterium]|nr:alpha/beta fold hydrolase [Bacteroidota bacterium]MDP4196815.1 alpha/beta fold hydrolase [Bacteroidota bacterium]